MAFEWCRAIWNFQFESSSNCWWTARRRLGRLEFTANSEREREKKQTSSCLTGRLDKVDINNLMGVFELKWSRDDSRLVDRLKPIASWMPSGSPLAAALMPYDPYTSLILAGFTTSLIFAYIHWPYTHWSSSLVGIRSTHCDQQQLWQRSGTFQPIIRWNFKWPKIEIIKFYASKSHFSCKFDANSITTPIWSAEIGSASSNRIKTKLCALNETRPLIRRSSNCDRRSPLSN